jgi:hypothetical protein
LLAQNPVLLVQALDRLQLALIHPASQGNYQELDWIKNFRHLVRSLSQRSSGPHNLRRFKQIAFSDQTTSAFMSQVGKRTSPGSCCCHQSGYLSQEFTAYSLATNGKTSALIIGKPQPPFSELLAQDTILLAQVFDCICCR